jgi:hypothetical protein
MHHHTAECSGAGRSLHQPTHHSKVKVKTKTSPVSNHLYHFITYEKKTDIISLSKYIAMRETHA